MERIGIRGKVVIAIILIAGLSRLFPVVNFSPIAAMGLFGGAYLSKRWLALTLPLLAVWFSDVLLNNTIYAHMNDGFTFFYEGWAWQYGAYLAITHLGNCDIQKGYIWTQSPWKLIIGIWSILPFVKLRCMGERIALSVIHRRSFGLLCRWNTILERDHHR